ncbi:tetratricopeptide repeat protein [Flavobacterium sp. DSR3-2]|uniref:tetratricopeptide repeat protein n=1 Tax=Flavobacterium sp. DSR3-2 TaxID=2804634 RepID=UPI003CED21C6
MLRTNNREDIFTRIAIKHFRKRNDRKAEKFLKMVIEANPNSYRAYNFRYAVRLILNDNVGAMSDLKKIKELDSREVELKYFEDGMINYESENYNLAVYNFRRAIELNKNYLEYRLFIARAYYKWRKQTKN